MSDWMTPEERRFFTGRDHSVSLGADYVRLLDITAKADARIRELEAQVKTARQEALEEAAKVCDAAMVRAAPYIGYVKARHLAIEIRALSRNEAQAKGN